MRVVLTGGGTGGHVYPAIAVAGRLEESKAGVRILMIGSDSGPEGKAAIEAGLEFRGIHITGFSGKSFLTRIGSLALFARGFLDARRVLKEFGPACVVGTGGFAAAPSCFAAVTLRIPLILHEMNARPGIVTRALAARSYAIATAYEETRETLSRKARCVVTGVPVRPDIEALSDPGRRAAARDEALALFGLEERKKTLFVFGGSQGAEALNIAVWDALEGLRDSDIQILHATGPRFEEDERIKRAVASLEGARLAYRPLTYIDRMDLAYAAADVAMCRSGAGTVAELVSSGVPSVLVPFPYASGGHQEGNAAQMQKDGTAVFVGQEGSSAEKALEAALELLASDERLDVMRLAIARRRRGSAAKGIVAIIEELS